ncbi:MAG TPA: hypothetical protein VHF67_08965 [Gaiellaceae bacterium]|nr:hypothetical protein [Gaiellaceae bacterium]
MTAALAVAPHAGAQASETASCIGKAQSSFAGEPGTVAFLTHLFHDQYKLVGRPPGHFERDPLRLPDCPFGS